MRITPMDIREQQFTVKMFRGFDVQEVDTFLEDLAEDYETLLKENQLLKEQLQAMEERAGARVVKAHVPLSEMFGYVGDLRSRTQGRANYSMVFDSYAEVPANVSKEIIAKATGQ